eukprot:scaffold39792_cov32-Tisochrysis_lutea.AAC.4
MPNVAKILRLRIRSPVGTTANSLRVERERPRDGGGERGGESHHFHFLARIFVVAGGPPGGFLLGVGPRSKNAAQRPY